MNVRTATDADLKVAGEQSVSRGCLGEIPDTTDTIYALEHEGELLAVGGFKQLNPTCAWVWLDLAEAALKHVAIVYRVIREIIQAEVEGKGLTRLQAAVEEDFPEAIRLVKHLGFTKESRMPRWSGDKAAFMYVRLEGA